MTERPTAETTRRASPPAKDRRIAEPAQPSFTDRLRERFDRFTHAWLVPRCTITSPARSLTVHSSMSISISPSRQAM